jgi:putative lipoprotein
MTYRDRVAAMILMALIATLLTACASGSQGPGPTSLLLTHWEADDIGGQPVLSGDPPTLRFTDDKGQVNGYAGCNRFFGTAEINGDRLSFGPLATTRMACGEQRDAQEHRFLQALEQTRSYTFGGTTLSLHDETGGTQIRLTRLLAD